ncbi:B3/B4 domain-containing protein [Oceanirhabdus sp. W0125-5]|uniref:B3/B4 domain-containing protein n=1 Tax=Oceanirhabdus sp. W0125-5 TaxID=2999116 RepID=UPI0022F31B57|nr:phenylalanine--tRNA ligase beta subunit-related protein [Oceanirhabdus sp. W0125-5]WBW95136.1 phenylalanine--tRNA ligase beta subunit-related protein [Oceanirhabdus sp. W0125-5]
MNFISEFIDEEVDINLLSYEILINKVISYDILKNDLKNLTKEIEEEKTLDDIYSNQNMISARECYKKLGIDPTRYRISVDSLYRRIIKGKGIYFVNPIVDCCNLISLLTYNSVGVYNYNYIRGEVTLRLGTEQDNYEGIGRGQLNINNMPVLCDSEGPFGSATSDSTRTMITDSCNKIILNIFSFTEESDDDEINNLVNKIFNSYFDISYIKRL